MVRNAQKKSVPIILCSLVENLKNFPPFSSVHRSGFTKQDSILWYNNFIQAKAAKNAEKYNTALKLYHKTLEIDSSDALLLYEIAECYYNLKNYRLAKKYFTKANDADVIRFRAPSVFNDIIQEIASVNNIPLADVSQQLTKKSPGNIIGNEYLHEHVHPNQKGYLEIAKSISRTILENNFINESADWSLLKQDSAYISLSLIHISEPTRPY